MRSLRCLATVSLAAAAVLGSCLPAQAAAPAVSVVRASQPFDFNVNFCGIYELAGSVTTDTHDISSSMYVRIPFAGRVKLTNLDGNLDSGVKRDVNVAVAQGTVTMGIDGTGYVWIDPHLSVKFVGNTYNCKAKLFKLP